MLRKFLVRVLCVVDKHVCISAVVDEFLPTFGAWRREFIVRHVDERFSLILDSKSAGSARVIKMQGLERDFVIRRLVDAVIANLNFCGEGFKGGRPNDRIHLLAEYLLQASGVCRVPENFEAEVFAISRGEEWKSLNMIPVGMAKQEDRFRRFFT